MSRRDTSGPAATNAGITLASAHFGKSRSDVVRSIDPVTIAALATLVIELISSCIASRRRDGGTLPSAYELSMAARRMRRATWLVPWTWPDWNARRQLESLARRRAVPDLVAAGVELGASEAVGLCLSTAEDAPFVDLEMLIKEVDATPHVDIGQLIKEVDEAPFEDLD